MRTKTIVAVFTVLFLVGTVFAGGNSDNANKVEKRAFTATEYPLAVLDPGTLFVSDGILHLRGMVTLALDVVSDPRGGGYFREVLNGNVTYVNGVMGSGTGWGTFQSCDEAGNPIPGWEGTYVIQFFDLANLNWIGEVRAQGTGQNKGLRFKSTSATNGAYPSIIVGVMEGRSE